MTTPIKRHHALQPLSREHHFGLLFCWKIREGFKHNVSLQRMKLYAKYFWNNHLKQHIKQEETYLFPILGKENLMIQYALVVHELLEFLFTHLDFKTERSLKYIERELEKHIRFEERELFNVIQEVATEEQLQLIEKYHTEPFEDMWEDEFWK